MIGFQNQAPLKSLNTRSSLAMLLRTLYRMGLNYCVLVPTGDYAFVIVFTKDQLVSLIERSSSEMYIAEIPKRVTQGLFKPVAIFKSDSSSSDFVSNGGFAEPERLQVLVIGEDGAEAVSLKEALTPRVPEFPEWWEAPVPFAMTGFGKLHLNHTAMLMFGSDLKRMPIGDIPDKNEFLVMLEGGESHCSVTFRRLEGDIFVLEDSTSDMTAAEEVAWWAAVGKTWAAALDMERRSYRRCDAEEAELLRSDNKTVLPCEWGGELLGYFYIDDKPSGKTPASSKAVLDKTGSEKAPAGKKEAQEPAAVKEEKKQPAGQDKPAKAQKNAALNVRGKKKKSASAPERAENEVLRALGPQTMGLLTGGISFQEKE